MPVGLVETGEGPFDRFPVQARTNVWVVGNVAVVVEIDEGMAAHGVVKGKRCEYKQEAKNNVPLLRRGEQSLSLGGPA